MPRVRETLLSISSIPPQKSDNHLRATGRQGPEADRLERGNHHE